MENQFIYRQERQKIFGISGVSGMRFVLCPNAFSLLRIIYLLLPVLHAGPLLKLMAKLSTPSRKFYCVILQNRLAGYGHVTVSRCRHYSIENGAVVIGPVWTREDCRGKGVATFGLQNSMNALISKGTRIFYIDTAENNIAMQHVIAKCGFGDPVERLARTKGRFV